MVNKDYKKLILVEVNDNPKEGKAAQSNKFYEMIWDGGSYFTVKYGRVEHTSTTISYPYSQWHKKYSEKLRKGYKDVTDFVAVTKVDDKKPTKYDSISDKAVAEFMELMQRYRDNLVAQTYSVKAEAVTQKQLDEAQVLINALNEESKKKKLNNDVINEALIALYTVIPRKMSNVKENLMPSIKLNAALIQEQDNLDAMSSQVAQTVPVSKTTVKKQETILDSLGLKMEACTSNSEIDYLTKQITQSGYRPTKLKNIFKVIKEEEDKVFESWVSKQKNKNTRILIHGTRCSSVIPILDIGLKIRPAGNFQFSGKAYGDGNYFSETLDKSLGYTGWQADKIILVYEVHVGNPYKYDGWYRGNSFTLSHPELSKRGFDSTFVSAGNGLLNSEIIAYKEEQCRIKYIIWLR